MFYYSDYEKETTVESAFSPFRYGHLIYRHVKVEGKRKQKVLVVNYEIMTSWNYAIIGNSHV